MAELLDVIIIGAGPAGLSTALNLLGRGHGWADRITILDKAIHPRTKLCAGGLTPMAQSVLARMGLSIEVPAFELRELRFIYRDLVWSFFGDPVLRVVRREEFDNWLASTAAGMGVTIRQNERVRDLKVHDDYLEVVTSKATHRARVVVAADGSRSLVRRALGWNDGARLATLVEILTPEDAETQPLFRGRVATFDFSRLTEGGGLQGYSWEFPSLIKGQAFMNRGVFDSRAFPLRPKPNLKEVLADALRDSDHDLNECEVKGHPIRWFQRNGRLGGFRVIFAGDAAGSDAFVGEGISFALAYGEVAAEAVSNAFHRRDFRFQHYRRQVLQNPLLAQLPIRTSLALAIYWLRSPRAIRFLWNGARLAVGCTRWRRRRFVPGQDPAAVLSETVRR